MNVAFFVWNMALGVVIPLALQLFDRGRMTDEEKRWVWGYATWGQALYNFGPLSLVAWGYVTRSPRYARGLATGAGLAVVALAVQLGANEIAGPAMGLSPRRLEGARAFLIGALVAAPLLALAVGAGRAVHDVVKARVAATPRPRSG